MKIGFILAEDFWQKKNIGSSRIRGHWVIKYLNRIKGYEAESFVQGKEYDVLVFQKTYWKEMARAFKGIKILDICDPDWLEGADIVAMIQEVDFITCSSAELVEDIKKMTNKGVYLIPDRIDFETLPPLKQHTEQAKKAVWFGYSGNFEVLDTVMPYISDLGLELVVISDGQYNSFDGSVTNVKWQAETVDEEIQKCDIAILPTLNKGRFKYKSNNKKIQAMALGLPVAENLKELQVYAYSHANRQSEVDGIREYLKVNYDVSLSAYELVTLIGLNKK